MPLDLQLLEQGGLCPRCRRKLRPIRRLVEYVSAVFPYSLAQTQKRATEEHWPLDQLSQAVLNEARPRLRDGHAELRCLVGLCGEGGETWG